MAAEKTRALVLRTVAFGETSSVVTLYTRDFGKVRALAKGAWRPKSGFDGALDLLSSCQVLVLRRSSGGLDLLTEASLEHRFRVGRSFPAFVAGMYVAELLDALTVDVDPQPDLFDVAHATLRDLSDRPADSHQLGPLLVGAELAVLRLTGHAPALGCCAECRGPLPEAGRTPFGMLDGGTLCLRCRTGKRAVISISRDALATLRLLAGAPGSWRDLSVPAAAGGEVRAVMNTYLSHVLGRPLRAASFLQQAMNPRPPRGHSSSTPRIRTP
jgi:DNA repair protein RecO (recombination protein O)